MAAINIIVQFFTKRIVSNYIVNTIPYAIPYAVQPYLNRFV